MARGEKVATLSISIEGMPDYTLPLYARDDVAQAGFADRILNGFMGWLS